MSSFKSIVTGIKSLRIQGAENVAKAGVNALSIVANAYKLHPRISFISNLNHAKSVLFKTRPTEPCLRNSLNLLTYNLDRQNAPYQEFVKRANSAKIHFEDTEKKISLIGAKKISKNYVVYSHCHSSTVIAVFKQAKSNGTRFIVHNTETRPRFQGRITAKECVKLGIPVVHYVDSAARLAIKKADVMLIGADAITAEGKVINKIGSELFAKVANDFGVPVYVCSDSWKFDPASIFGYEEEIEQRNPSEVWFDAPRGVKIDNHAFERISPDLISGIISELGVFKPDVFIEEVKSTYPWMF